MLAGVCYVCNMAKKKSDDNKPTPQRGRKAVAENDARNKKLMDTGFLGVTRTSPKPPNQSEISWIMQTLGKEVSKTTKPVSGLFDKIQNKNNKSNGPSYTGVPQDKGKANKFGAYDRLNQTTSPQLNPVFKWNYPEPAPKKKPKGKSSGGSSRNYAD